MVSWTLSAAPGAQAAPGAISVAEAPGASPNFIFPLDDCLHASTNNVQDFQQLMFRPLYWFGLGTSTTVQYPLSLANPPRVTNHGRTFNISLKGWRFANGQVVNAGSVKFFLNLFKSNPTDFCSYTPGFGIPDQLSAVGAVGNALTLKFSSPESLNYVLDNYLSQITPMPTSWSRSATGLSPRCATGAYGAATTIAACGAVLSYLNSLATNTKSFAGRFWQSGVDGPWTLTSFDASGDATFTSNPHYSGAQKPRVATLKEVAYTSFAAELGDLTANKLTIGYVDPSVLTPAMSKGHRANLPALASKYVLAQVTPWSMGYGILNYSPSNPDAPLLRETYIRQALQMGVDQPSLITQDFNGFGVPTYSPLPVATPASVAAPTKNPLPFNPAAAHALLLSHGWTMVNSSLVCQSPGTAANECGASIPAGTPLTLKVDWTSGSPNLDMMMQSEVTEWLKIGFRVTTNEDTLNNVIADCHNSATTDLCVTMNGWTYTPANFPSGEELFSSQGASNFGGYSDGTMNILIHRSIFFTGNLTAYAAYAASQVPVIFQPQATSVLEVSKALKSSITYTQNPLGAFTPEYLSF